MRFKIFTALLIATILSTGELASQKLDFEDYPKIDVTPEHLDASIRINEQKQVTGDVDYRMRFLINDVDSIVFNALGMQVEDVLLDERTADFEVIGDKLVIFTDEQYSRNSMVNVRVKYTADPAFGLHRNYMGTVFSSSLPNSSRHWLPGIDQPGVSFTTDLTLIHPSGKNAVATGQLESSEVISVDEESSRFRSRFQIAPSDLFIAFGDFETKSRTNGSHRIYIHSEVINISDEIKEQILDKSAQLLNDLGQITGADYPHRDLHIILMNDNMWEKKNYYSGVVIASDLENPLPEIHYGIIGQWAGVYLKPKTLANPDALKIMKGYLAMMTDFSVTEVSEVNLNLLETSTDYLYNAFLPVDAESWIHFLDMNPDFLDALEISMDTFFSRSGSQYNWYDAAHLIYQQTGQPYFENPDFEMPEREAEDEFVYSADLDWNEEDGSVTIQFTAEKDVIEELVSVKAIVYDFDDIRERSLDFTGAQDEVVISVPATVENVKLTIPERDDITLQESKPFMFWIYQLQNDEDENNRKAAARGLSSYADNPDLQLALLDILGAETNAEVYAETIRTLSKVTDGASGTAQIYLDRARTDQHKMVQLEAVKALAAYRDNDQVISRLRSLASGSEYRDVRLQAIHSLSKVVDADAFLNIAESLMLDDRLLYEVPDLMRILTDVEKTDQAIRFSETFLSSEFPPDVRIRILSLMQEFDDSASSWENRLQTLLRDSDPRIRYKSASSLQMLSESERENLVNELLADEFDERVYRALTD